MPSPDTKPSDWNPWVMVLVAVICVIFLFFNYFRILQRQCTPFPAINLSRNSGQRRRLDESPVAPPSLQYESLGLDSYIMHSIPITQFEKNKDEESCPSNTDCAVCLGEFEEGQWVKHLPNCSHVFHVSCIDTWFQTHSSCPLCRSYVCNRAMQHECSVSIYSLLETLNREDFLRERSENYQVLRAQILRNGSL
ncbi:E3 ubiquitin-protein ligase [Forsythia ovata]|uniref:RING-type E3 ubiquitin transferase n=1 Tax=Forsythia ovata TaxID=205694 RepID=A0ABD1RHD1_9LAMI